MGARGVLRTIEGDRLGFWCPGCKEMHVVGPTWQFNGDFDKPTFSPSIKVTGKQIEIDENNRWTGEWVRGADGEPIDMVCHSFVRNGRIEFLGDCTHLLASKTIPLEPFDE